MNLRSFRASVAPTSSAIAAALALFVSGCAEAPLVQDLRDLETRSVAGADPAEVDKAYTALIGSGALTSHPDLNADAYRSRAIERMRNGDYRGALADVNHALTIDNDFGHSRDHCLRGLAEALLGDRQSAKRDFAKAMDAPDGYDPEISRDFGYIDRAAGRLLMDDVPGALQDMANAANWVTKGRYGAEFAESVQLGTAGMRKYRDGDYNGAIADLKKASDSLVPTDTWHPAESLGILAKYFAREMSAGKQAAEQFRIQAREQEQAGNWSAAFSAYAGACIQAARAHDSRLLDQSFHDMARLYRRLAEKPVLPADVIRDSAVALDAVRDKNFDDAAEAFEAGLRLAPWWPEGQFNAALVQSELRRYDNAVDHMKKYLALAPDAPNARAAQDKIYVWERKAGDVGGGR